MRTRVAAVPEPCSWAARQGAPDRCGAQKLGLAACPSANIGVIDSPQGPQGVGGVVSLLHAHEAEQADRALSDNPASRHNFF